MRTYFLFALDDWGWLQPAMGWSKDGRAWKPLFRGIWIRAFWIPWRNPDEPLED
jgi:hypothetical protein